MSNSLITLLLLTGIWSLRTLTLNSTHILDGAGQDIEIRFYGVKIKVADIEKGREFYSGKLGYAMKEGHSFTNKIVLETGSLPLILEPAKYPHSGASTASIAFQVNKLLPAIDRFRNKDIQILDGSLSRNGIGIHINFEDPFGNRHSLIEVQGRPVKFFREPRIYNAGFRISNMEEAKDFYITKLGFSPLSLAYLPNALPLGHKDQSFAFMLHYDTSTPEIVESEYPDESQTLMVFTTPDLRLGIRYLEKQNVKLVFQEPKNESIGRFIAFEDPFGNISELYELR